MTAIAKTFAICDLFTSIQGEGGLSGKPFVFLRFWGCPLACPWCDEPRHRNPAFRRELALPEIVQAVENQAQGIDAVLLTGGEPLAAEHLAKLVNQLKKSGKWVAMETSGVGGPIPEGLDWITLSPKTPLPHFPTDRANEIKFVLGHEPEPAQEELIHWWTTHHGNVWLQPRWQGPSFPAAAANHCLKRVLASGGRLRLSLQIHKWLNIP